MTASTDYNSSYDSNADYNDCNRSYIEGHNSHRTSKPINNYGHASYNYSCPSYNDSCYSYDDS